MLCERSRLRSFAVSAGPGGGVFLAATVKPATGIKPAAMLDCNEGTSQFDLTVDVY